MDSTRTAIIKLGSSRCYKHTSTKGTDWNCCNWRSERKLDFEAFDGKRKTKRESANHVWQRERVPKRKLVGTFHDAFSKLRPKLIRILRWRCDHQVYLQVRHPDPKRQRVLSCEETNWNQRMQHEKDHWVVQQRLALFWCGQTQAEGQGVWFQRGTKARGV